MLLKFLNLGITEMFFVLIILLLIIAIGNYGKNTALGYWGSVLLSILSTPIVAFIIISIIKLRSRSSVS
ncbi:ABC-type transport system involved in multi-copper enzyme maturation permease subunit [Pedobacter sp. CAN_A7]